MPRRYTDEQKTKKLAKYHHLRKSGKTAQQAAKAVGVTYLTLRKWEKVAGKPKKPGRKTETRPALKSPAGLTVTTREGFRIEADNPKDIIAVLKALK